MKLPSIIVIAASATLCAGVVAQQQAAQRVQKPSIPNERMDYAGFRKVADDVEKTREQRRITEERFIAMASEPGTIVLDARSRDKYAMRHIKGAVSLPFTDFTDESLAKVIPNKHARVLIYCNNNFRNDQVAFATKTARAALNISTFIALTTYGYDNVYELGPLLDVKTAKVEWAGTSAEKPLEK